MRGEGYLLQETVKWLKVWLEHSEVTEGAVLRRLGKAQWIGIPEWFVGRVSGHSTRVGATQDLATLDIDLAAITQAGAWKLTRMPLQYAEKIDAARSGIARAAEKAGRDSPNKGWGPIRSHRGRRNRAGAGTTGSLTVSGGKNPA